MPGKTCEVCGDRTAMYVCQNCGSSICPVCKVGLLCKKCSGGELSTAPEIIGSGEIGIITLLAPIAIIITGFFLVVLGSNATTSTITSGCIFWPFPIIVGCGVGSGGALTPWIFFLPFVAAMIAFWLFSIRGARRD